MKKKWLMPVGLVAMSSAAMAGYIPFIGANTNPVAPYGAMSVAANWQGGAIPYGSDTGLVTVASGGTATYFGSVWTAQSVRQTGGTIYDMNGQFNLRGGATNSGISTVYEIEDSRVNYQTYTNARISNFTLYSQNGETPKFNLLSGRVVVLTNTTFASPQAVMNIKNGLFTSVKTTMSAGRLNMLAGGDADINFGQMGSSSLSTTFNFESGNTGTITIEKISAGTDFGLSQWNYLVINGRLMVDNSAVTTNNWQDHFMLSNGNKTITLRPRQMILFTISSNQRGVRRMLNSEKKSGVVDKAANVESVPALVRTISKKTA